MKYQSELVKELVDKRGHEKSSLHYQSECIDTWIEENKGAYPKLCDYQSEWLNYIVENPIGMFPYETVTTDNTATIDNVVPYAYKSAILKGQTLVNIKGEETNELITTGYYNRNFLIPLVKKNTDYLIKYDTTLSGGMLAIGFLINSKAWSNNLEKQPNIGTIRLNSGEEPNYFRIIAEANQTFTINNLMIIEYQQDMENWNISYFEGMQSVKMPILTTTGKNLLHSEIQIFNNNNYIRIGDSISSPCDTELQPNTTYTLSWNGNNRDGKIRLFSDNTQTNSIDLSWYWSSVTFTTSETENGFAFYTRLSDDGDLTSDMQFNVQLEKDSSATTYEPYQSIILTTNNVILRSNGAVKDELNCLNGEFTQRIGENGEVLSQEIIKTVELTITNQDGETLNKITPIEGTMNIITNGTPIRPTVSLEIPVEAITKNLNSFIEE